MGGFALSNMFGACGASLFRPLPVARCLLPASQTTDPTDQPPPPPDMAYGNKLQRIVAEAESIMVNEKHRFVPPVQAPFHGKYGACMLGGGGMGTL